MAVPCRHRAGGSAFHNKVSMLKTRPFYLVRTLTSVIQITVDLISNGDSRLPPILTSNL